MATSRQPSAGASHTTLDVDLRDAPMAPRREEPTSDGEQPTRKPRTRKASRRLALGVGSVVPGTPYRLHRWLGDGGMGAVFEAQHVDTERRVAVKVLHAQRRALKWVVDGFRNEARASARIGSPHIVDIYDFKELDDGRLLIAMEYLEGPTLHEALTHEPMPWSRLVAITRQICKGLSAAHRAGIVHRDIKPENIILIRRDQREDFVKILDFGVALFINDGRNVRMSGTAQYMAPESSDGKSDARADIYSVGCLLYALVVGDPPFDGESPSGIMRKQREVEPLPLSQQAERPVPADLDALVMRCLAKDADERYQSMDELEAALCELQIAHGWVTAWDDLAPPEVDQERRTRIEDGLRDLSAQVRPASGSSRPLLLGLVAAAVVVIAVLLWPRSDAEPTEQPFLGHAQAAQRAAARFYFVYPPRSDPQGTTAYRELLAIEAFDTKDAQQRGAELREEFATTLVRLGDRYWDFEGARPFAYEYYASALVFVEDERARERTGLTSAGLERLRSRAATGNFTELELLASEPLVALAESDPDARAQKLVALEQDQVVPATVAVSLERVLEHPEHVEVAEASRAAQPRAATRPSAEPTANSEDTGGTTGAVAEGEADADTTGSEDGHAPADDGTAPTAATPPPRSTRDPAAARKLVAQAKAAVAAGNRQRAEVLFGEALEVDSHNVDALGGLGKIAFNQANYSTSVKRLERAVRYGKRRADLWLLLGDAYFKTVRYTKARDAYRRAQDLGNGNAAARLSKVERKIAGRG